MSILAIDIGSRFADLAVSHAGQVRVLKQPVGDRTEGAAAMAAIGAAVAKFGLPVSALTSVRIGSTGAINAVLQRKGARIALIATQGFSDTFFLARQNRKDLYDPVATSRTPEFLLDEADIYPISGRIGADGFEVSALDRDAVTRAADKCRVDGVDAIAVCLLFSHLNPAHELACLDIIRSRCPDIPVSLSHHVDPQPREYERTISVCLDAWLKPQFLSTAHEISEGLAEYAFKGQLLFGDGRGALISAHAAMASPAAALASGPAAAAHLGSAINAGTPAQPRLIMDIGSVSCDLSYVRAGATPPLISGGVYGGIPVRRDMVDLHSLSLGGRHVAQLHQDQSITFALRDRAGQPTLELALRACGRADPPPSPSDLEPLDAMAAQAGWPDATATAERIIAAAELKIASAIVSFAVQRNIDPAQAQLVALGGLGPLLATGVASLLSIRKVLLPHAPAAAGASGLLTATPRYEASLPLGLPLAEITPQTLSDAYTALTDEITNQTAATGVNMLAPPSTVFTIAATARMHPMQIELTPPPKNARDISCAFESAYHDRYSISPPSDGFVFSLQLRRDETRAPLPPCEKHEMATGTRNAELFMTSAGAVYVPASWHLDPHKDGYALQQKEQY